MERKLKISELARIWSVTTDPVRKRLVNLGLSTFKDKENNREIDFVLITDEQITKYEVNKSAYNDICNIMLTDENPVVNNDLLEKQQIQQNTIDILKEFTTLTNGYNEHTQTLYNELTTYKSQFLLLEDKASREGLYLQQIKDLETDNKQLQTVINKSKQQLLTVVILAFVLIIIMALFMIYKLSNPVIIEKTNTIEKVIEVEKPVVNPVKKR